MFFESSSCFLLFVCCQYFVESFGWYIGYCVFGFGLGCVLCVANAGLVVFVLPFPVCVLWLSVSFLVGWYGCSVCVW